MIDYSDDEQRIVLRYERKKRSDRSGSDWDSDELSAIRSRIKKYFVKLQRRKCCHCRQDMNTSHGRAWDTEHLVPRSTHPQFMLLYENLAASCIDCNSAKGDANILKRPRVRYPNSGDMFSIIHPHFDIYGDHISIKEGILYLPKTDKGRQTIYTCDLMRFIQRKLEIAQPVLDARFEGAVDVVFRTAPSTHEAEQASAEIDAVIAGAVGGPG